jgi:hypothetical protein
MSLRHTGEWHYEQIVGRNNGREWRVADEDDDFVTDFKTEEEALDCVRSHNETRFRSQYWKY